MVRPLGLTKGVLTVTSGNDIHLYSPAYWQEGNDGRGA